MLFMLSLLLMFLLVIKTHKKSNPHVALFGVKRVFDTNEQRWETFVDFDARLVTE